MENEHPDSAPEQSKDQPAGFLELAVEATTLGWNLVVPIVGGVLLGRYLDDKLDKEFTWTLTLLLMGVAVAFNNLYTMYVEHSDTEPLRERIRKRRQQKIKLEKDKNHEKNR
jgi:predicted F0F1-ATPase subunit